MTEREFMQALVNLNTRVAALETEITHWAAFGNEVFARLQALEDKPLVIVDADGVITATQEGLLLEQDEFRTELRGLIDAVQRQIHQHLADHEVNGGRPRSAPERLVDHLIEQDEMARRARSV